MSSKLHNFRLKDNFLRFYLKHIFPNQEKIKKNNISVPVNWSSILGLQFENLVLNNRKKIIENLNIPMENIVNENPYFQRSTKFQSGCQIDYLIQTRFSSLFLCEIKFKKNEIGTEIISEIEEKINKLKTPRNFSIRPVLIHVNGLSDELLEKDYFYKTIDFSQMLE
jgi:uncharacterized protein